MGIVALKAEKIGQGIVAITDSKGYRIESDNPVDLLRMIAKHYDGDLKVVWDMSEFIKCLKLPPAVRARLLKGGRIPKDLLPDNLKEFRIFYGEGKGKRLGVGYTYRQHIRDNFYEEVHDEADVFEYKIYNPYINEPDVDSMVEDAERLLNIDLPKLGVHYQPTSLTSPGVLFKEAVLNFMDIPTVWDMEDEQNDFVEYAANICREWRCCYQVGYFPEGKVWDYDKNASYPSIISKLPSIHPKYVEFIYSPDGSVPEGAFWGVLFGDVTITKEVSPIIHENEICYKGTWEDYLTTDDIDCIERHHIGYFKPKDGWFIRIKRYYYPFSYVMRKLYDIRNGDDRLSMLSKLISVQIIGMFAEKHEKDEGIEYGDYYNPLYAAMVKSIARCELCDFIYANDLQEYVITATVDGCLSTKEVKGVSKNRVFGEWRVSEPSHALVVDQQFQWYGDKRPAGVTVDEMVRAINKNPNAKMWGDVSLSLPNHTRVFEQLPKNGKELMSNIYKSKAIVIEGESFYD